MVSTDFIVFITEQKEDCIHARGEDVNRLLLEITRIPRRMNVLAVMRQDLYDAYPHEL